MPDEHQEPAGSARFALSLLVGAGSAALTAVAAAKPWFAAAVDYRSMPGASFDDPSADSPLALACALVALAAWGVVLVTGTRARRVAAGIGAVAAAGVVACVAVAPWMLPDKVRENLLGGAGDISVHPTGWYVTSAVGSVLALVVLVLAQRLIGRWPTMSSRYDAPGTTAGSGEPASRDAEPLEVWKALDEGRDPTDLSSP